jgi:hypothetical protein
MSIMPLLAQWTGFIKASTGSTYTFFLNADDSVRLFVDNTLIIDTWKLSAPGEFSGTYTFPTPPAAATQLLFEIVLQYRQVCARLGCDDCAIELHWFIGSPAGSF